jgi:RHS repeat-associated protein
VEKAYDHAASTKQFVFVDKNIAEERNATGTVTKQFYPQGVSILSGYSTTGNFYYTRDHLGSVRELLSDAGTIVSRLNYDPYGRTTLVSGTNLSDFQYAGMYMHQTSGLNLTLYRAYDPNTARWLSRDPLGKEAGSNLYGYVANNPIIATDPLGLILHIVGDPTNILQNLQKILKGKVSVDKDGNVQRSPCSQDQDFDRRVDQLINSKTVYNIRDQEDPNHFQRPDSYDPNTHTIEVNDSTYTYPDGVWNPFSEAVGDEASALGHELMRAYANDNGEPQDDSDTARQNVVNRANPAYTRQGLPPRTGY